MTPLHIIRDFLGKRIYTVSQNMILTVQRGNRQLAEGCPGGKNGKIEASTNSKAIRSDYTSLTVDNSHRVAAAASDLVCPGSIGK